MRCSSAWWKAPSTMAPALANRPLESCGSVLGSPSLQLRSVTHVKEIDES